MKAAFALLVAATAASIVVALWLAAKAPVEAQMGIVQKIFYFHVPSAYAMYLGVAAGCGGSAVYLWRGRRRADVIARAGAEMVVLFAAMTLTSGPLWGWKAWGTPWVWDPRLTTTLLLALVFVAYLALRAFGDGEAEKKFAAAIAVLSIVVVPVIHYSVRLWRGQHPTVITERGGGLDPEMKTALTAGFVAFTLLFATMLWYRIRVGILEAKVERLRIRAVETGVSGLA
jgi:heme exporter protein C